MNTRTREVTELKRALAVPERVALATTADQLKAGVAALQGALSESTDWSSLLDTLAKRTVSGVVLESSSIDEDWLVRVSGSARSYLDVAQYLNSLQSSGRFTSVELESSALNDATTGTSVTFSLKATYVPKEPATGAVPDPSAGSGSPLRSEEGNGADQP